MFARFSTVAGERGAADAERDIRGFAVKFYTEEGNWDWSATTRRCSSCATRSSSRTSTTPSSATRAPTAQRQEQLGLLDLAARGAAPDHHRHERPRHSRQLSPHARLRLAHLQLHQRANERFWVKFHFKCQQGIKNLTDAEAAADGRQGPRKPPARPATKHRPGRLPEVDDSSVQIMPEADAAKVPYHPFDLTKVWPHKDYPLIEVGVDRAQPQPGKLTSPKSSSRPSTRPTWCPASASRRTRCCRGGCSPTATRSATGWASTTTRFRSTPRAARCTATTATAPCVSTATTAARSAMSRTARASGRSSRITASRRCPGRRRRPLEPSRGHRLLLAAGRAVPPDDAGAAAGAVREHRPHGHGRCAPRTSS
jgi:hypothetical protein